MALVFADNAQGAYVDEPRTIVGSNLGYGKYRVFYDTIDFSAKNAAIGDDVVIANLTTSSTVWSLFRAWATTAIATGATLQIGLLNKASGTFYPVSPVLDLETNVNVPVTWDTLDTTAGAALPAVVEETFEGEATRKGRESDAWLVLRVAGATADAGVIKFEIPATVE